jgi:putative flippase GtrA
MGLRVGIDHIVALLRADGGVKLRFLIAGTLNTTFGLGIFPLLMLGFGRMPRGYLIALVISHPLSIVFAYITNKYFTFRTRRNYLREFAKFSSFYLINFAANLVALPFCVEVLRWPAIPSQLAFATIVMALSYFWHSRVTFRQKAVSVVES